MWRHLQQRGYPRKVHVTIMSPCAACPDTSPYLRNGVLIPARIEIDSCCPHRHGPTCSGHRSGHRVAADGPTRSGHDEAAKGTSLLMRAGITQIFQAIARISQSVE